MLKVHWQKEYGKRPFEHHQFLHRDGSKVFEVSNRAARRVKNQQRRLGYSARQAMKMRF